MNKKEIRQDNNTEIKTAIMQVLETSNTKKKMWEIIKFVKDTYKISVEPVEMRKHIQEIRENNSDYTHNDCYILADNKGYWLSKDIDEMSIYQKAMIKRHKSLLNQMEEMQIAIEGVLDNEECNCL